VTFGTFEPFGSFESFGDERLERRTV